MSIAADQAKERGNKAYSSGNYKDAVSCFNEAISIAKKESISDKVYFSNRCAAYLKLDDGQNALNDANECIKLDENWAKGYSRKGAALFALKRYQDAAAAYKSGLKVDPANVVLQQGLARCHGAGNASSGSIKQFVLKDPAVSVLFLFRFMGLVQFVLYLIPGQSGGYYSQGFGRFFKVFAMEYLLALMNSCGRPQKNLEYGKRVLQDSSLHMFAYCLLSLTATPYVMSMVPVLLVEMVHITWYIASILTILKSPLLQTASMVVDPIAERIVGHPQWKNLSTSAKWNETNTRLPVRRCVMIILLGISNLFQLLTPSRNFMHCLVYWQYIRLVYSISITMQDAFRQVDGTLLRLLHHPKCPPAILRGYMKVKTTLSSMATPPSSNSGQSPFSKCNIL